MAARGSGAGAFRPVRAPGAAAADRETDAVRELPRCGGPADDALAAARAGFGVPGAGREGATGLRANSRAAARGAAVTAGLRAGIVAATI